MQAGAYLLLFNAPHRQKEPNNEVKSAIALHLLHPKMEPPAHNGAGAPPATHQRRPSAVRRQVQDEYDQIQAERAEFERNRFRRAIASTTSAGAAGIGGGGGGGGGQNADEQNANNNNVSLLGGFAQGALKNGDEGPAQAVAAGASSSRRSSQYSGISTTTQASSYKSAVGSAVSGYTAGGGKFVPSAPSNLPKVCAGSDNPASKALCLQMCQPAACCFDGKMTAGTGLCEVANLYTCSEYDGPCDIVLDMMDYGLGY